MEELKYPPGSRENPITCKGIDGERAYLNRLRSPEGKPVEYQRLGSVFVDDDCILDGYRLQYDGLVEPAVIYLNMYAGGRDKRIMEGFRFESDFLKPAAWEKLEYFQQVAEKELGSPKPETPKMFVYIWTKSGRLLRTGPWIYAENDFFRQPNLEWDLNALSDCASQVVHQLRGISEDRPVVIASVETALQFMQTMHFEFNGSLSEFRKNAGKFEGRNDITGEEAVLYFSIRS